MDEPPPFAGVVVWITGRPQTGKSTFAARLAAEARRRPLPVVVLDGDEIRAALVPPPGYDVTSRDAFYATLANLAAVVARQGSVVVVAATAHATGFRARARERAEGRFVEVFIDADEATARARDGKGLYQAAMLGQAPELPGGSIQYEAPSSPDVVATGGHDVGAIARALARALELLGARETTLADTGASR
jgi:adenylylsulfate kinase